MRLLYTRDNFSRNEKAEWRINIFQNIINGLHMIVDVMEEFGIPFENENLTVGPFSSPLHQTMDVVYVLAPYSNMYLRRSTSRL
jgi:hypothetical protein